eukprot:gene18688-25208_t
MRSLLASPESEGNITVLLVDPSATIEVLDFGSQRDFEPINGKVEISTIVFLGPNNAVVDLTDAPLPMSGLSVNSGLPFDHTRCEAYEMYALQEAAEKLFKARGGDISKYKRRIVIVPNMKCSWWGLASQGCFGDYCYASRDMATFFHELGHTFNLQHSSTQVAEYGPPAPPHTPTKGPPNTPSAPRPPQSPISYISHTMPSPSPPRSCFNAPTSQRAGRSSIPPVPPGPPNAPTKGSPNTPSAPSPTPPTPCPYPLHHAVASVLPPPNVTLVPNAPSPSQIPISYTSHTILIPSPPPPRSCFNAPTSQRAGWSIPIGVYTGDNFTSGKWYDFTIPALTFSDKNFVRYNGSSIYDVHSPFLLGNKGQGSGMQTPNGQVAVLET